MNDAAEAVEAAPEADAPLINPSNAREMPEAVTEQPMPLHDDSNQQQPGAQFTTDDAADDEPLEKPDWYPQDFWDENGPDVEKLAKSHVELRKLVSQGKHKAPEGDYDYGTLQESGLDTEEPGFQVFKTWAKKHGVSQMAFDELGQEILSTVTSENEAFELDRQQEMSKLGDRGQDKIAMVERLIAKAPLTDDEQMQLAYSLDSADSINAFIKYHQAITNESIPVQPAVNAPQMTRQDLEAAIADPRWLTDVAWRTSVEKQWMDANN